MFSTRLYSSLVKIFQRSTPTPGAPFESVTVLRGEVLSFQIAYRADEQDDLLAVKPISRLKDLQIRSVECVPVRSLAWELDDDALIREPGLMPDLLADLSFPFSVPQGIWRALWITARIPEKTTLREFDIAFEIKTEANGVIRTPGLHVEVLPAALPPQKLLHTEWFHSDCLAAYYDVPVFSEEYWYLVESFLRNAADHGVSMILTPVFTPPLDTQRGGERPTVQLVDVYKNGDDYAFGFDHLARWIALAQAVGIRNFEISHLATQWGAEKTPKIIAQVDGKEERIFGWDVSSNSPSYRRFLAAFLPALTAFLEEIGVEKKNVWFHTSDEPHGDQIRAYRKIAGTIRKYTPGFRHLDALSDIEFYRAGVVETPIPCIHKMEPFLKEELPERWMYYCCCPTSGTTNRFLHQPSPVTRALGMELFRYNIRGFLHWGFNFYFSRLSRKVIDPFQTVDADYKFPAGDAFLVYPGPECEPLDSIRNELMREALQDQRALDLLARLTSRKEVEDLLDQVFGEPLTVFRFPQSEEAFMLLRNAVYAEIQKQIAR